MRASFYHSAIVGTLVAICVRVALIISLKLGKPSKVFDILAMTIVGFIAAALYYAWKYQCDKVVELLREREKARRHANHNIRNALSYILMAHYDDEETTKQVHRAVEALEIAFPRPTETFKKVPSSPSWPVVHH